MTFNFDFALDDVYDSSVEAMILGKNGTNCFFSESGVSAHPTQ